MAVLVYILDTLLDFKVEWGGFESFGQLISGVAWILNQLVPPQPSEMRRGWGCDLA